MLLCSVKVESEIIVRDLQNSAVQSNDFLLITYLLEGCKGILEHLVDVKSNFTQK